MKLSSKEKREKFKEWFKQRIRNLKFILKVVIIAATLLVLENAGGMKFIMIGVMAIVVAWIWEHNKEIEELLAQVINKLLR